VFAIIDIETCGSKFDFKRGRITEICILLHDGLQVTEKFTTLINPECYISSYFTHITGITNEMVENAPRFYEVAQKIWEYTEGRIFVAHNVMFDYNFIKDEFASLGAQFKRETLCTVRLSRKLIPGKKSYSLGTICSELGIDNIARHRAEGDATATAELFNILMQLKSSHPQYKNKGVEEIMARRIDNMKQYILKDLPEECGVYYFYNNNDEIIYIGKSKNVYQRALSHFNSKENKGRKMLNDLYKAGFTATGSELIALLVEAEEIKKHKPRYNRSRKSDAFTHCINWQQEKDKAIRFYMSECHEAENTLCSFTSYGAAREMLEQWIDEKQLCISYCGLVSDSAICFNHQIKKCRGICVGQESDSDYNLRARQIVDEYLFADKNFALVDCGRKPREHAIIYVENGHYKGYGYMDESENFSSKEELKGYLLKTQYYPDADDILRGWLKNNRMKKIVFK